MWLFYKDEKGKIKFEEIEFCKRCKERFATQNHAKDKNHLNWERKNREALCVICHSKEHGIEPKYSELRELVTYYERYQKTRIAIDNTVKALVNIELDVPEDLLKTAEELLQKEKEYREKIGRYFEENPFKECQWCMSLKGINIVLAAKLLSRILGRDFLTEADLWKFAGVDPGSIKKKGERANWNQDLHRYLLGDQQIVHEFIIQRTPKYREIYDKEKEKQKKNGLVNKDTGKTNKHAERRARRVVAKYFLRDLHNRLEK